MRTRSVAHTQSALSHSASTMGSRAAATWYRCLPALCSGTALRVAPVLRPASFASIPARRNLNVQTATEAVKLKSIDDLPGPSRSTSMYWLLVKGYAEKMHLLQVLEKNLVA